MRDLYKILDVEPEADYTIIKTKYRALARKYHPDKTKGDEKKTKKFQEVATAYAILGNEKRRAAYDRAWAQAPTGTPGSGFSPMFGRQFDDIIERVEAEGIHADNIGEIFDEVISFAEKFQKDAPAKVQEAADRIGEQSDGGILSTLEVLFNMGDKRRGKRPSR